MAGEGQFHGRGENAQTRGMDRIARRQDKGRLGQVELAGDGLHPGGVKPSASGTTASGLPAKGLLRENIEQMISQDGVTPRPPAAARAASCAARRLKARIENGISAR